MKLTATAVLIAGLAVPAIADTDRLSAERKTAIEVAFELSYQDPEMHNDRLSPARMAVIQAAFATHDPQPDVDNVSFARWTLMQAAYESLGATNNTIEFAALQ